MKKTKILRSLIIAFVLVLTVSTLFAGCTTKDDQSSGNTVSDNTTADTTTQDNATSDANTTSNASISGSCTAVGSSALQPLAERAAELFMEKNKDAKVQIQGGGSGTGLKQVSEGNADIGNSDVYAAEKLPEESAKGLVDHKVCVVGFAAVVNSKVTVTDLTNQQLIDIFTGKVTNWKDVGGSDMKIVILNRPSSSGTRATFKKYALNGAEEAEGQALTEESSGAIKQALEGTDGAISYLALSYIWTDANGSVKTLKLNGIEPTLENITSGKYPIWSYEHMYTKGEPTGIIKAFLDYMVSDEFKPEITKLGYIPNSEMKVSRDN